MDRIFQFVVEVVTRTDVLGQTRSFLWNLGQGQAFLEPISRPVKVPKQEFVHANLAHQLKSLNGTQQRVQLGQLQRFGVIRERVHQQGMSDAQRVAISRGQSSRSQAISLVDEVVVASLAPVLPLANSAVHFNVGVRLRERRGDIPPSPQAQQQDNQKSHRPNLENSLQTQARSHKFTYL
jgi:hypothetical protein